MIEGIFPGARKLDTFKLSTTFYLALLRLGTVEALDPRGLESANTQCLRYLVPNKCILSDGFRSRKPQIFSN